MKRLSPRWLGVVVIFFTSLEAAHSQGILGYLEPYRDIGMNVSEPGIIRQIPVNEGEVVSAGDLILGLDNRVLEAQLETAKIQAESTAAITVANADIEVSKLRYGKLSRMGRSGTAQNLEIARAEADVKKAEGQLSLAEEENKIFNVRIDEIQAMIEQREIRSTIDGVVLEINGDVGEPTAAPNARGADARPLVRVAQIDRLRLEVYVPSSKIDQLKTGEKLPVRVLQKNSLNLDREDSAIDTEGVIEFVSVDIDPSSETIRTRLVIENADGRFRSGSHALVLLD